MVALSTVSAIYLWDRGASPPSDDLPTTYEGWLYDGFYAESRFECDRSAWGGTVVWDGNPVQLADWDEDDLTVPVLAYDALELDDENVWEFLDRTLPWLHTEDLIMERDGPDAGRTWKVVLRADGIRVEIDRRGRLVYERDMAVGPGDVIGSTERMRETFIDYLERNRVMPAEDQVRGIEVVRGRLEGSEDRFIYEAKASRRMEGLELYSGEGVNQILARYEAGTGRLVHLSYHWPLLVAPFAVTDLPSPEDLLDHIVEQGPADPTAIFRWSDDLQYYEPNHLFRSGDGFVVKAEVFFFLPYRAFQRYSQDRDDPSMQRYETHHYGVIFPDMVR
jgi:hypothetical protein